MSAADWDFEGEVTFLTPDEGGLADLPSMNYWPSFRYSDVDGGTQFIARPVAGFRLDRTPYRPEEGLARVVVFRFRFPDRDLYDRIHRDRLKSGCRFELMEGFRPIARGLSLRRREDVPPVEAEIEALLTDLHSTVTPQDEKEVLDFLYRSEWECALNFLWASVSLPGNPVDETEYARFLDLGSRVGLAIPRMEREFPLRRID